MYLLENAPYDVPPSKLDHHPQMIHVGADALGPELDQITNALCEGIDRLSIEMCEALRDLPAPREEKRALQRHIIDPLTDILMDLDDFKKAVKGLLELNKVVMDFRSPSGNRSIGAFLHDLRNIFCALQGGVELHLIDNDEVSLALIAEAEDAMRCFIDQRPQNLLQMQSCAEMISPLKLVFLGTPEMENLPCSYAELLQIVNNAGFNANQVGATEVVVSCMPIEGHLLLYISDDGPGFTSDCIATVSAQSKANDPLKGNGLGIIDHIVKKYGGEFRIGNLAHSNGACLQMKFPQH